MGGFITSIYLDRKIKVDGEDYSFDDFFQTEPKARRINFGALLGLGVSHIVNEKFKIGFEPIFRIQLFNYNQKDLPVNRKFYSVGLDIHAVFLL